MNRQHMKAEALRTLGVVVILLVVTACGTASAPLTAAITAPTATTPLLVGQSTSITGSAAGSGLKTVEVYVDGVKLSTVDKPTQNNQFDVLVPWAATKPGAHVIQLKGLDDKGTVLITSDAVFITVQPAPATVTPTQPPQPSPTVAPTSAPAAATATPAATAVPAGASAAPKAENDFVNVRKGPAVAYDKLGTLLKGQNAPAKGKNADGSWWQISFPAAPDGVGWVKGDLVDITGDTSKVPVATAPALPTAPPQTPTAGATQPPAATATSAVPPAALLPYSQNMRFNPRDDIGDVPLGNNGEGKTSNLIWEINGAKSVELEITAMQVGGIFQNCPTGDLSTVSPNNAVGKRLPLQLPSGSYQFSITGKGYYLFTLYVTKADGSTTTIPRNVIVDCYKTQ
jgi:uncharacterized protein YraI